MTEEKIIESLRAVLDPEIGINIVDLGMVYNVDIRDSGIFVQMTMTTPTCPLHAVITRDAEQVLQTVFEDAKKVEIELVWDPIWNPSMMSDSAKQLLGWE
ncbi:MAG: metal-sulfur cluster assembly factor [Chloroflexota bacterium]